MNPEEETPADELSPDYGTRKAHLITFGWNERQRALVGDLDATHVEVDLTTDRDVPDYVLAVVDAASLAPAVVIAVGPLAMGWACAGRLADLRDWCTLAGPGDRRIVITPDDTEQETFVLSSEAYQRLGAHCGLLVSHERGRAWLMEETQDG